MSRALFVGLVLLAAACGRGGSKPAGTVNDPVTVCERLADVCRYDGNKLGVCAAKSGGTGFTCASQH
jgi:hypothetical protein